MVTIPFLIVRIWLTVCQVFTSFIMQSSIAIVAFVGLLSLAIWRERNEKRRRGPPNQHGRHHFRTGRTPEDHSKIPITAMVAFQKSQCYFASAIQIAAIVFATAQNYGLRSSKQVIEIGPNFQVSGLPFIICTNGYIPVVFTLTCVGCYGRQSWYLTLLALCCFILSTTAFIFSNSYAVWDELFEISQRTSFYNEPCGYRTPEQFSSWCGSGFSGPTPIDDRITTSGWNYIMWMVSFLWALYCVIKQSLATEEPQKSASHSFIARFAYRWRLMIASCDRWI